jgi:hypothetical protein
MRAVLLLPLLLAVACATSVHVGLGEGEDLSRLRSWNWLPPGASPEIGVDARDRNAGSLHTQLGRLVEHKLRAQGFPRSEGPDFFVGYHLVLEPRKVVVKTPRAPYLLLSMTSAPSYWIEGFDEEVQAYEDFRLVIGLFAEPGRLLWRGVLERKIQAGGDLPLEAAVAELLDRLPRARSGGKPEPLRSNERPEPPPVELPRLSWLPSTMGALCIGAAVPIPSAAGLNSRDSRAT